MIRYSSTWLSGLLATIILFGYSARVVAQSIPHYPIEYDCERYAHTGGDEASCLSGETFARNYIQDTLWDKASPLDIRYLKVAN